MFSCDKIACCTLFWYFRSEKEKLGRVSLSFYFLFNFLRDVQGSPSERAVTKCHAPTLPPMIIHHLNIAVITWSNFEAGIDVNGIIIGVIDHNSSIDVVDVSAGVNVAVVKLREGSVRCVEHWARCLGVQSMVGAWYGFERLMLWSGSLACERCFKEFHPEWGVDAVWGY